MISNKPFLEVNYVLNCFPEASNAGYVLLPIMLKLAIDYGITPLTEVLKAWEKSDLKKARVVTIDEALKAKSKVVCQWKGPLVEKKEDTFIIGLERLLKEIKLAVLIAEIKILENELKEKD